MSNFFYAIGVADMEKVHSAVIGWMLSDKCEGLNIDTRSKLLQKIFGIEEIDVFTSITSFIEWKNIDILIVTTNKQNTKECWIIENKIKSSQHSDQLNRYVEIINCKYLLPSSKYKEICKIRNSNGDDVIKYLDEIKPKPSENKYAKFDKHYCFLTLIDEVPISKVRWKNTTYSNLAIYLEDALKENNNNKDYIILNEYLICVRELSQTLESFIDNYSSFPHVFIDGRKTKEEKQNITYENIENYICENGLEMIFQKCLLGKIKNKYQEKNYPLSDKNWKIEESSLSKAATVVIQLEDIDDHCQAQIEFQNGSFKVQIKSDTIDQKEFVNKWSPVLKKVVTGKKDWSVNLPTRDRSFISISNKNSEWYRCNLEEMINYWKDKLEECNKLYTNIQNEYKMIKNNPYLII